MGALSGLGRADVGRDEKSEGRGGRGLRQGQVMHSSLSQVTHVGFCPVDTVMHYTVKALCSI